MAVPCGRCYACLRNYQMSWIIRLKEEQKVADNCYFITLTYNEENIPRDTEGNTHVEKTDVQKFIKRLRKRIGKDNKLRYYLAAEYGPTTMRPHYHAVLFNLPSNDVIKTRRLIAKAWSIQDPVTKRYNALGFVQCDSVNENRIAYVTGYCMDKHKNLKSEKKVFSLMSQGLGKAYLNSAERFAWHKDKPLENLYYPLENGKKLALPRYYRTKIISSEITREVLRGITERESHLFYLENRDEVHKKFAETVAKNKQQEKRYNKNKYKKKL